MRIVFEIIIVWLVLSCTLGLALTWFFFYGERRARTQRTPGRRARRHEGAQVAAGGRAYLREAEAAHPDALLAGRRY
jgi:hypothetical protein